MSTPLTLFTAQTAAVSTPAEFLGYGRKMPATLIASGLQGAEVVVVQVSYDGGTNWVDYAPAGTAVELSVAAPTYHLEGPARYGVTKAATTGNVGCYVSYARKL